MLRSFSAVAGITLLTASAAAQLPPTPPRQPDPMTPRLELPRFPPTAPGVAYDSGTPQFLRLSGVNKEKKAVIVAVTEAVPVTAYKEVVVDETNGAGQVIKVIRKVPFTELRQVEKKVEMSLKGVEGTDGAGNKLRDDQLWERLANRKVVLIVHNRDGLDASFRDVIARDAVILIMPPPTVVPVPPERGPRDPLFPPPSPDRN